MPKTISVLFSPIPQILGIVQTYHKSIVYDKGDGSVPLMIEGRPQISWGQGTPEQNANQGLSPGREIGGGHATPRARELNICPTDYSQPGGDPNQGRFGLS